MSTNRLQSYGCEGPALRCLPAINDTFDMLQAVMIDRDLMPGWDHT